MTADSAGRRIDLALEADFRLGGIEVRPSTRQIEVNGTSETLEPRIMQVFVALARRCGQVISRDELIETCWDGRVVGDDALNRCIARIRKLGEAKGDFRLETIPRVGYRLWAEGSGQLKAPAPAKWKFSFSKPIHVSAAILIAVIAAGLVYLGILYSRTTMVTVAPSVAVMPFVDRNGDQPHLAGGMTDELISRLRQTEGLAVTGGDWAAGVLKEAGDPQAVGKRLSVTHLVEGSIRRDGNRLRVTARLTSTQDGRLTWTENYEKELSDIFAVQDEIARSVANALSVVLDTGLHSTHYGGTSDFEAYEHYLRGRELRMRGGQVDRHRQIEELRQAIALDPNYARAWFELSIAVGMDSRLKTTMEERDRSLREMDEASRKAEMLAPDTWFAHAGRGWYHIGANQWLAADQAFERLLATGQVKDPDLSDILVGFNNSVGRWKTVRRLNDQWGRVSPRWDELVAEGNFEGAWEAYKEDELQKKPGTVIGLNQVLWALSAGDLEAAKPFFRRIPGKGPNGETIGDFLDRPDAGLLFVRPILDQAGTATRETYLYAALMAGHFGDTGLAVEFLRRAYLGPGWGANFYIWYPQLRETRRTEGFRKFVTDLGMVEMWRASGDWGDFCRPLGDTDFECT